MLQNLHVKNLALIDETEVEFSKGLNILTGETGAGKSIIIGSINLALGQRVPKEMLKENDEPAFVELIFSVDDEKVRTKLQELDIDVDDDTIILSRKMTYGKSVARINGTAVSASVLKEVASLLIDIHGQHEHQSLLSKKKHLDILDAYAKNEIGSKKEALKLVFSEYKKLQEEWNSSNIDTSARARELSLLEFEIKEIEEASLRLGEDEELEEEFKRFSNGRKILEAVGNASDAVDGKRESASELIGRALRDISSVSSYDKKIAELENQLMEIENLMHDFNHELSKYIADTDFDEQTFYEIEKRLDIINHMKSKYGNSIESILQVYDEKCERLSVLNDYDAYLQKLSFSLQKKEEEVKKLCEEISMIRQKNAKILCDEIKGALLDLNFLDVNFTMEFGEHGAYTSNGYDEPEFMISTNPGESVKPLVKVASGGEMSRIMLAIKTVMADSDEIETLIFDEIDSGISGRTAQMVAEKMNVLGNNHQIICITHLPQIAAMADAHYLIEKKVENNETHSNILKLKNEDSIHELARMLGGVEITDVVVKNAQEMKELARMKK
ncbi:MAG: DNA repair protein RecN [Agathobacter sp.]|nr:DNA repair protein RecN [Agathobacter sp.]